MNKENKYKTLTDMNNAICVGGLKKVDEDLRVYRGKKILIGFSPKRGQYYICYPSSGSKFARCVWYSPSSQLEFNFV